MKLYLAGPMRGRPDNNFPAFHVAARELRQAGYTVVNPAELDGEEAANDAPSRADWCAYLKRDLKLLVDVDGIATLDGWEESEGANLEVDVARRLDITAIGVDYWLTEARMRGRETLHDDLLVGLIGYAQAGKDSVADQLIAWHGFTGVAFADRLKALAFDIDPIVEVESMPNLAAPTDTPVPVAARPSDYDEHDPIHAWDVVKSKEEGRRFLQALGVAARDHLDVDVWVDAAMRDVDEIDGPVVVTDVRFANEVRAIRERGGVIVQVHRPGVDAVNNHASEALARRAGQYADYTLHNDMELADLRWKVGSMLDWFGRVGVSA